MPSELCEPCVNIDFKDINDKKEIGVDYCDSLRDSLAITQFKNVPVLNDILTFLSFCDCCDRHQINKPIVFSPWLEIPLSDNHFNICRCDCRHLARIICRQHNDYNGEYKGIY